MTDHPPQRIGDADRDRAAECLREHLAQGRLTQDEFDDRLTTALGAKTSSELEPLFADLPDPRPDSLKGVEPMSSPWPNYPPQQPAAAVPAPRPQPQAPVQRGSLANVVAVATAVAWPVWLLASFATGWHYWWLIWIPIIISVAAGALRRQSDQ